MTFKEILNIAITDSKRRMKEYMSDSGYLNSDYIELQKFHIQQCENELRLRGINRDE